MKIVNGLLLSVFLIPAISCEKEFPENNLSYIEHLRNRSIINIQIKDDTLFILSSRYCDTCHVPPYISSIPQIVEWTVIHDASFRDYKPGDFSGFPVHDNRGNSYIAKENTIFKLNDAGEYERLINTGSYVFTYFTFDMNDNIWFYGDNNGIAFWNKSELKIYNTLNSELPVNRIHGLAVDRSGIVWISLDFKGLLKIENQQWTVIPNSGIPGMSEYSYLTGPKIVDENSVWFEVFNPDTTSCILRYRNDTWNYEFPDDTKYSVLIKDSRGTIWAVSNFYNYSDFNYSTLKYYNGNSWSDFDISGINSRILSVNADDHKVYIGTTTGLYEKLK
jgi:hypothetical protein